MMPRMRKFLLVLSLSLAALFAAAFVISLAKPVWVERLAREMVRIEVERRAGHQVEVLSNSKLVSLAQKALGRTQAEIEATQRELAEKIPQQVAAVVRNMLDPNCECRKRWAEAIEQGRRACPEFCV